MSIGEKEFEQDYSKEEIFRLLEEQYNNPEIVEIDGQKLEIIDLKPPTLKTEVPLVIVPGWSATAKVLRENIIILAKLGRRVIVISAPHGIETEDTENYPLAELRKTAALLWGIKHKGFNKVDAVSHSEAGVFLAIGAMENSDKFRNLIFVSPAGMIGRDTLARLTRDFTSDIIGQTVKGLFREPRRLGKISRSFWEATKAVLDDPKKTWEEIKSMVNYQIPDLLAELKKQGHGISIIHGVSDKTFPMDRVQKLTNRGIVDGFVSVKGSHNEMYLKPHPFTEWVDHLLDAMEKKLAKKPV